MDYRFPRQPTLHPGVLVAIVVAVVGVVYLATEAGLLKSGCAPGQQEISGYSGGHYVHLCASPGAPVALPVAP